MKRLKEWNGFKVKSGRFHGKRYYVVEPHERTVENKWVWRTEFFDAFAYADVDMVSRGWVLVYLDMHDLYGSPKAVKLMENFYSFVVKKYSLNSKASLFGFSRGGLYALNFASENAEHVHSLYLDAPVVDINSWPFGMWKGKFSQRDWEKCKRLYSINGFFPQFKNIMETKIKYLSEKSVPIVLVYGDCDKVVPFEENGKIIEQCYDASLLKVVRKEGVDHHPHSLIPPTQITDFLTQI